MNMGVDMLFNRSVLRRNALLTVVLLVGLSSGAIADTGYIVSASSTFSADFRPQEPITVSMEVRGVMLGSVFFDDAKMNGFLILQNRTPISVTPKVGVSLYDGTGKLIATGIDVTPFSFSGDDIRPGDQKNIELSFGKFINDYSNVKKFQIVLSVGKPKGPPADSKSSADHNIY
jgi:hypothetical protein